MGDRWKFSGRSSANVVMEEIHGNMTVNYVQLRGLDESALYLRNRLPAGSIPRAVLMHGGNPASCRVWGVQSLSVSFCERIRAY